MSDVVAVVPLNVLSLGKGRLSPALDARARVELVLWMLERVVRACAESQHVTATLVVAGDAAGAEAARRHRCADVVVQPGVGLDDALAHADALTAGAAATLVVAADIPLVTAADLDEVCSAGATGRRVVIAEAHDGGTAALLRRPAATIATSFGVASAAAHARAARQAGIRPVRLRLPRLALDVDTAEQLRAAGLGGVLRGGRFPVRG